MLKNKFNHEDTKNTEFSRRKVFSVFVSDALSQGGLLLCTFALSFFVLPAAAQNATILPVLDPATIFADGVEVVETFHTPLVMDNEQRVLFYRQSETDGWSSASYPDGTNGFTYFEARSDGTFLLLDVAVDSRFLLLGATADGMSDDLENYAADEVWLFDPAAKTITHPVSKCGVVKALANEGKWRWIQSEQHYNLCNTENGATIVLPQFIVDEIAATCGSPVDDSIESSPTKRWIVFSPCYDNEPQATCCSSYTLYAYDTQTGNADTLVYFDKIIRTKPAVRWIDEKTLIFNTITYDGGNFFSPRHSLYAVTLTPAVEVQLFANSASPLFLLNPPRYMWFEADALHEYRFDTRQHTTLLHMRHKPDYFSHNTPLFSVIPQSDAPLTGYVASILGSEGTTPFEIYDLASGDLVYATRLPDHTGIPPEAQFFAAKSVSFPTMFTWLDEDTFMYVAHDLTGIYQVTLAADTAPQETFLPLALGSKFEWAGWSPDNRYVLLNNVAEAVVVYNWQDQQQHAIFQPLTVKSMVKYQTLLNRRFVVYWQPDNTLAVQLWDQEDGLIGSWRIRIDNLFAEGD